MLNRYIGLAVVSVALLAVALRTPVFQNVSPSFSISRAAYAMLTTPMPHPAPRQLSSAPSPVDLEIARIAAWIRRINPKMDAGRAHNVANEILCWAHATSLDPRLVVSLVTVESAFHPRAVSPVGALGLGQLMPDTAKQVGVTHPLDVADNLKGCTRYLHQLLSIWACKKTPLTFTIASYNAGPGAVTKYHGVPPFPETQNYVKNVLGYYHELGGEGL